MSYVDDLIDMNGFQDNFTSADGQIEESNATKSMPNDFWSNEFNTEQSGLTKLVSSEEDIISSSGSSTPKLVNVNGNESPTDNRQHMNNGANLDDDGFASNVVLTVGEYQLETAGSIGTEEHRVPSMADHWGNTEYNTVLRTNYANQSNSSSVVNPSISQNKTHRFANVKDSLCSACKDKVYVTETLVFDRRIYHKKCFKCAMCNGILRMNNASIYSNELFCNTHYTDVVKLNGKYNGSNVSNVRIRSQSVLETYNVADELPPRQNTKINVEKFRQLESRRDAEQVQQANVSSKRKSNVRRTNTSNNRPGFNMTPPVNRINDDVRQSTDELPTPGITKMLLEHWTNIGSSRSESLTPTHRIVPRMNILNCSSSLIENGAVSRFVVHGNSYIENVHGTKFSGSISQDSGNYAQITSPTPYNSDVSGDSVVDEKPQDVTRWVSLNRSPTEIDVPAEGITKNMVGFFQTLTRS